MNSNYFPFYLKLIKHPLKRTFLIGILAAFVFSSCRTARNNNYLIYDPAAVPNSFRHYDPPIKIGDQLDIKVSALNMPTAIPYQVPDGKSLQVDSTGKIFYPLLGQIQANGITRNEMRDALLKRLRIYLTDPVVTVDFANFKISVLGEVNQPGTFPVNDGKVNIFQALSLSGDLTIYGQRQNVSVIRELNGQRVVGKLDLQSNEIFNSEFYQLQQNDIVYVSTVPEKPSAGQERSSRRFSNFTAVLGVLTSVTLIVVTLFRRD